MTDSLIHLRVPAALKGRWIRESRAAGLRLTDWIISAVETGTPQRVTRISVPPDVSFSDLALTRGADGALSFDWSPIHRVCEASGLDADIIGSSEDNLSAFLGQWYGAHLAAGGNRDAAMDELLGEAVIEDARGQTVSHPPGRA